MKILRTGLLILALSASVRAADSANTELATITVKTGADTFLFSKNSKTLVATMPAKTAYEIDSELEWSSKRQGDQQIVEIKLPTGQRVHLQSSETDGQVVLKLLGRATVTADARSEPNPLGAGSGNKKPGENGTPAGPAKPAIPPEVAGLLSQLLGKPPGEVKFDPAARTDFELPRTPAAAAIGSKAETIRPSTPRAFATELLSKVGDDGAIAPGFAFAASPYLMLSDVPLDKYRSSEATRFLTRLQLSVASAKGGDLRGKDSVLVSTALSGLVFDFGDPRRATELDTAFESIFPADDLPIFNPDQPPVMEADKIKRWSNAIDKWNSENWNKPRMGFGYAPRWFSATGKTDDLVSDGGVGWLTLSLPGFGKIAKNTQFLSSVQYRHGEKLPLPATPTILGDAELWSVGAQVRFGSARFNGFAEAYWNRRSFTGGPTDKSWSYEVGAEKRLTPSLWLQLSYGKSHGSIGGQQSDIKTGLRYAFGDGPQLELK